MGFSRQEYWSGLLCLPPGDLPNPWIEPRSPELQADFLPAEPPGETLFVYADLNSNLEVVLSKDVPKGKNHKIQDIELGLGIEMRFSRDA